MLPSTVEEKVLPFGHLSALTCNKHMKNQTLASNFHLLKLVYNNQQLKTGQICCLGL